LILTMIMLRGMNRSLFDILTGKTTVSSGPSSSRQATASPVRTRDASENRDIDVSKLMNAGRVIMVPGYGMALAQAQWQVKSLYDELKQRGVDVKFAIHPVAGRMPGHMNVLLAEVEIPYDRLYDLKEINHEFSDTDVVVVVGACDVVNPAANTASGTPIYGMPVLNVQEAGHVIVCNRDDRPGYSGVENSLYVHSNVTLVTGDAADSLNAIISALQQTELPYSYTA
ncbi:MAG TPA: NAD(P)(+) transhydrogenase (Re/Si-specific) subunit beta, partial [Spirochaetota bacterium]|nr:NAD(P)(+) transhydrogenase (Re/Si-specific) subunit beta [Spirochaetota bacterium]